MTDNLFSNVGFDYLIFLTWTMFIPTEVEKDEPIRGIK